MSQEIVDYQRCPVCRPGQEKGIKIYSPKEMAEIVAVELSENRTFRCIRCKLRVYVSPDNKLKKPKWDRKNTGHTSRATGGCPRLKEGKLQETINTGTDRHESSKHLRRGKSESGKTSLSPEGYLQETIDIEPQSHGDSEKPEGETISHEDFLLAKQKTGLSVRADETQASPAGKYSFEDQLAAARMTIQSLVRQGATLDKRFKLSNMLDEQGATSLVVLASDLKTNKSVVVKFTPESMITGEDGELCRRRIDRVYEIQSMLSESPHVAAPIALLKDEEAYGYVTVEEYVEAVPLSNALKGGKTFNQSIAVQIVIQIGSVLELAREASIVHRDIKPANILIHFSEEGEVRVFLIDWGIARSNKNDERDSSQPFREELSAIDRKKVRETLTQDGVVIGTPSYMAPEQLDGGRVDGRTDIYSLAATIYSILSGSRPFEAESLEGLIDMVMLLDPVPLKKKAREKKRRVSKAFSKEIAKALLKNPEKRHQTADEFVLAIVQSQRDTRRLVRMGEPVGYIEKLGAFLGRLFWKKDEQPGE